MTTSKDVKKLLSGLTRIANELEELKSLIVEDSEVSYRLSRIEDYVIATVRYVILKYFSEGW